MDFQSRFWGDLGTLHSGQAIWGGGPAPNVASPPPTRDARGLDLGRHARRVSKESVSGLRQRRPGALADVAGRDVPKGSTFEKITPTIH